MANNIPSLLEIYDGFTTIQKNIDEVLEKTKPRIPVFIETFVEKYSKYVVHVDELIKMLSHSYVHPSMNRENYQVRIIYCIYFIANSYGIYFPKDYFVKNNFINEVKLEKWIENNFSSSGKIKLEELEDLEEISDYEWPSSYDNLVPIKEEPTSPKLSNTKVNRSNERIYPKKLTKKNVDQNYKNKIDEPIRLRRSNRVRKVRYQLSEDDE